MPRSSRRGGEAVIGLHSINQLALPKQKAGHRVRKRAGLGTARRQGARAARRLHANGAWTVGWRTVVAVFRSGRRMPWRSRAGAVIPKVIHRSVHGYCGRARGTSTGCWRGALFPSEINPCLSSPCVRHLGAGQGGRYLISSRQAPRHAARRHLCKGYPQACPRLLWAVPDHRK